MDKDAILAQLRDILSDNAVEDRDWATVDHRTTFEELGIDSLSILDLLYDVDQVFDIHLEASDVVDMKTIGEIVDVLHQRQAEPA